MFFIAHLLPWTPPRLSVGRTLLPCPHQTTVVRKNLNSSLIKRNEQQRQEARSTLVDAKTSHDQVVMQTRSTSL